jgi:hypothetical protein
MQKFFNKHPGQEQSDGGVLEPFIAIFMGFGEILGAFIPSFSGKKKGPGKKGGGAKTATIQMKLIWTNYKKSHQLLTW